MEWQPATPLGPTPRVLNCTGYPLTATRKMHSGNREGFRQTLKRFFFIQRTFPPPTLPTSNCNSAFPKRPRRDDRRAKVIANIQAIPIALPQ